MKPFRLHVGPVAYDVRAEDCPKDGHGDGVAGFVKHDAEQVRVDALLPKRSQHVTVIHEMLHTIFQQAGQRKWYANEALLDCIAYGLAGTAVEGAGCPRPLLESLFTVMEDEDE